MSLRRQHDEVEEKKVEIEVGKIFFVFRFHYPLLFSLVFFRTLFANIIFVIKKFSLLLATRVCQKKILMTLAV